MNYGESTDISVNHVITTIERGGAEKQLLILIREQIRMGFKVNVFPLKGEFSLQEQLEAAGAKVLPFSRYKHHFLLLRNLFFMRSNMKDKVLIHAHLPRAEVLCRLALLGKQNAFVISRHNSERFFPSAPNLLSSVISRWVTRRAQTIITISEAVKKYLTEHAEVSPKTKIQTVYYGYDQKIPALKLRLEPIPERTALKLVTIGRLTDQKNYPFLFQGLNQVLKNGQDLSLTILGKGELESTLKREVSSTMLGSRISWKGTREEIHSILCQHDAFVITSKYEGFCLALLEAMQAALPIIAPRNSAFTEVLGVDHPGIFVDGDVQSFVSLTQKLKNDSFYLNLSNISQKRLGMFNPRVMERKIADIYDEVLDKFSGIK